MSYDIYNVQCMAREGMSAMLISDEILTSSVVKAGMPLGAHTHTSLNLPFPGKLYQFPVRHQTSIYYHHHNYKTDACEPAAVDHPAHHIKGDLSEESQQPVVCIQQCSQRLSGGHMPYNRFIHIFI